MSENGPAEVVDGLRDAAAAQKTPVYTLPSQASEYITRTAAHLRTMQTLSYFHSTISVKNNLVWNSQPLTEIPPYEISYSGM